MLRVTHLNRETRRPRVSADNTRGESRLLSARTPNSCCVKEPPQHPGDYNELERLLSDPLPNAPEPSPPNVSRLLQTAHRSASPTPATEMLVRSRRTQLNSRAVWLNVSISGEFAIRLWKLYTVRRYKFSPLSCTKLRVYRSRQSHNVPDPFQVDRDAFPGPYVFEDNRPLVESA